MKTLLVSYTPRMERSSTKVLLDTFRSQIKNCQIEELDLCIDVPPLLLPDSIAAAYSRGFIEEPGWRFDCMVRLSWLMLENSPPPIITGIRLIGGGSLMASLTE